MAEIKKNEAHEEEIFDQELKELMGDRYVDATVAPVQEAEEPCEEIRANPWATCKAAACLIAADALLMFMCLTGKIELAYGLAFLAVASAFFGAKVNDARV